MSSARTADLADGAPCENADVDISIGAISSTPLFGTTVEPTELRHSRTEEKK
jgi:hypothetical protein